MIHLEVLVADTGDLLDAQAYGAGALLRWESGPAVGGVYAEGGTLPLVAGVSLYDVWDSAGLIGTWYRTRISDAGGTTFSPYSTPFQTAVHGLYLSVDQFRAFQPTTLSDESLLILLDAAAQAIITALGYSGETTEWLRGSMGPLLMLSRPALSVTAVVEDSTTLAINDYQLSASGNVLRRTQTGDHPRTAWRGPVDVTYLPRDDYAERQRVQRELVALDLSFQPGLAGQTIGTWSETYAQSEPYATQRAAILASLNTGVLVL